MSSLSEIEGAVPDLRRYAWSLLRDTHEADDLVQECLTRALGSLAERENTPIRPWLFTIMHNLFISQWRKRRYRARFVVDPGARPAEGRSEPSQEWALAIRDLLRSLDAMPAEQRYLLLLVSVEGFSYGEAAAILGIPVGTVMSRLSRARDMLQVKLGETGKARPAIRRVK